MFSPKVAVIDSGIDMSNQVIMQQVLDGFSFQMDSKGNPIIISGNYDDVFGHGTNCADYILQLADRTLFYPIRIVNEQGKTSSKLLIAALEKCKELQINIVCLSLSVIQSVDIKYEREIEKICRELTKKGTLVCASEGNNAKNTIPAVFDSVIGVGAPGGDMKRKICVNQYDRIQVRTDTFPVFVAGKSGRYNFFKGTSKANAYITGMLAKLIQNGKELKTIEDSLEELEKIREMPQTIDKTELGKIPTDEKGKIILQYIQKGLLRFGCMYSPEEICKYPFFSKITGINFFNFYDFINELFKDLKITEYDYHSIKIEDVCTLYKMVEFLKKESRI